MSVIDKLRSEPVRAYLYTVLVAVTGALVAYGIISADEAVVWGSLVQVILAVPAVEIARAKVSPTKKGSARHGQVSQ